MKIHSYRCDHCSNLKGESNHWWLRVPDREKFTLQRWDDAEANTPGYEHICSESCAAKALSKWMARPDTQPEVQVLAPSDVRVLRQCTPAYFSVTHVSRPLTENPAG
jgi:hypothetical protein